MNITHTSVDAAFTKAAARTVKSRLEALGHSVSLNHAYEAVAATFGSPTWAVMKSRIANLPDDQSESSEPATITTSRRPGAKLGWSDILLSESNPVVLVHGPVNYRRSRIVEVIASEFNSTQPRVRGIFMNEDLPELFQPDGNTKVCVTLSNTHQNVLNIFDTKLGLRTPSAEHADRIAHFLMTLLNRGGSGPAIASLSFARSLVDAAYVRCSDSDRHGTPLVYGVGIVPGVDVAIGSTHGYRTWWSVVDGLLTQGKVALAIRAQRHAVPRLEHLMSILRCDKFADQYHNLKTSEGEGVLDACARMISTAIRENAVLQRPTNLVIDPRSEMLSIKIETPTGDTGVATRHDVWAESILYRLAVDALEKSLDSTSTALDRPCLFVLSGINGKDFGDDEDNSLVTITKRAHENENRVILVTSEIGFIDKLTELSSSVVVSGCATRRDVDQICRTLSLPDAALEEIHEHLFTRGELEESTSAYAVRQMFRSQKTGLVEFPTGR